MTLGRKLLLKTAGLILSLVLLACVALWGLLEQHTDLARTDAVIERRSEVHRIGSSATFARALLLSHGLDPAAVEQMRGTTILFTDFRNTSGPLELSARRQGEADAVMRALRAALADADRPQEPSAPDTAGPAPAASQPGAGNPGVGGATRFPPAGKQIAALNSLVSHLADLGQDAHTRIQEIKRDSDARRNRTAIVVTGLALLIVAGAMALSFSLYRGVMRPLRRLHGGVRSIARGRFSQRLEVRGDREFVELARDFNQMAEELEALYQELEEEVAAKSKELVRSERLASVGFLAAGVAHEINNPLGIITGYAELARRSLERGGAAGAGAPDANTDVGQALQVICDEAFRCKQITEKLLQLARATPVPAAGAAGAPGSVPDAGDHAGPQGREVVALDKVADDVALMVRGLERFRDRKLETHLERGAKATVLANAIEMKQVLLNLTLNALEAVDSGRGVVQIEVRAVEEGGSAWVEMSVADNGRGMEARTLEHVFEPFFTDRRGKAGPEAAPAQACGVGLGLSIVHAIVTSRGGQVRAQSAGTGKGSRFTVRLPAARV